MVDIPAAIKYQAPLNHCSAWMVVLAMIGMPMWLKMFNGQTLTALPGAYNKRSKTDTEWDVKEECSDV